MVFLKKKIFRRLKLFSLGLVCGILGCGGFFLLPEFFSDSSGKGTELAPLSGAAAADLPLTSPEDEDNSHILADSENWFLALINRNHPLDPSYVPAELAPIDSEHSVDARIVQDLQRMMEDGAAQGLRMYVTSAYRSYDQQIDLFNTDTEKYISDGLSPFDAYNEAARSVAVPGTSEHASGLAVDIIADGYTELDERQADTPEQQWLFAHCHEYGFILRYPEGREEITGIVYEPWHYRYVGTEAAAVIMEEGITLEEYLERSSS